MKIRYAASPGRMYRYATLRGSPGARRVRLAARNRARPGISRARSAVVVASRSVGRGLDSLERLIERRPLVLDRLSQCPPASGARRSSSGTPCSITVSMLVDAQSGKSVRPLLLTSCCQPVGDRRQIGVALGARRARDRRDLVLRVHHLRRARCRDQPVDEGRADIRILASSTRCATAGSWRRSRRTCRSGREACS